MAKLVVAAVERVRLMLQNAIKTNARNVTIVSSLFAYICASLFWQKVIMCIS